MLEKISMRVEAGQELPAGNWKPLNFFTKSSILDFAILLHSPLFRLGYSLVTEVGKEAPNRMKISHCIKKVFHRLLQRI